MYSVCALSSEFVYKLLLCVRVCVAHKYTFERVDYCVYVCVQSGLRSTPLQRLLWQTTLRTTWRPTGTRRSRQLYLPTRQESKVDVYVCELCIPLYHCLI